MSISRSRVHLASALIPWALSTLGLGTACGSDSAASQGSPSGGTSSSAGAGGMPGGGGVVGLGGSVPVAGAAGTGGALQAGGSGSGGAAGGAPVATCPDTATLVPGETSRTIQVGGVARTYILHVPASYSGAAPVPLVLDFHGLFGSGASQRDTSGYLALSEEQGFIVAYPDGIDAAWNIGPCCTTSRTVDDLGFARALVEEISAEGCVDDRRVYATGYSMGGGMSYYLACNAAEVFAAVAPAAFDLLEESEEPCAPSRPISVIAFRGTADFVVPYTGGASNPPNGLPVTIHFLGAQATFDKWRSLDGCTDAPVTSGACQTSSVCDGGVEVTLCTAVGGGHDPGDARLGWETMNRYALP